MVYEKYRNHAPLNWIMKQYETLFLSGLSWWGC